MKFSSHDVSNNTYRLVYVLHHAAGTKTNKETNTQRESLVKLIFNIPQDQSSHCTSIALAIICPTLLHDRLRSERKIWILDYWHFSTSSLSEHHIICPTVLHGRLRFERKVWILDYWHFSTSSLSEHQSAYFRSISAAFFFFFLNQDHTQTAFPAVAFLCCRSNWPANCFPPFLHKEGFLIRWVFCVAAANRTDTQENLLPCLKGIQLISCNWWWGDQFMKYQRIAKPNCCQ